MPAYGYSQTDLTRFRETGIDPHDITSGTSWESHSRRTNEYRWARYGIWSLKYWPDGGGAQGFVDVPGIGTVVDVDDEMPHEVWVAMLAAVDSPLCP